MSAGLLLYSLRHGKKESTWREFGQYVSLRHGAEINVEKTKVIRISRQPSPLQITVDKKTTGQCGILQLFWSTDNK
jgi:hypothetical protein